MKAALYCKFPIEETGGPEILEQELILIRFMQQINGTLYAIYVDRGIFPPIPNASFLQMMQDGLAHRFDVILCITPKLFYQQQNMALSNLITIFPENIFPKNPTHIDSIHIL